MRHRIWALLTVLAVTAPAATSASAGGTQLNGPAWDWTAVAEVFADEAVDGCFFCGNGSLGYCYSDEHGDAGFMFPRQYHAPNLPHGMCVNQSCDNWHTRYDAVEHDEEDLQNVLAALATGDDETIAAELRRYPWMTINWERGAIQEVEMDGRVLLHVPVDRSALERFAAGI